MQVAVTNNGVIKTASSLVKRVDDLEEIKYYCPFCKAEVIPRIGDFSKSYFARIEDTLHNKDCPEIILSSSRSLPSSNNKFVKSNLAYILELMSYTKLDEIIFKQVKKDIIFTPNSKPSELSNKLSYVIVNEVANRSGRIIGLKNGLKFEVDDKEINDLLIVGNKFICVLPIKDNVATPKQIDSFLFYDNMNEEQKMFYDKIINE